jgi:hypothetical protein
MRVTTRGLLVAVAFTLASGCTNVALRNSTHGQASTLTELQYQMVLTNLATMAANPGNMPWHANMSGGATQMTDST